VFLKTEPPFRGGYQMHIIVYPHPILVKIDI